MKRIYLLFLAILLVALVGCSKSSETPAMPEGDQAADRFGSGEIDPVNQMALGTLKLEGTEHAVTPTQAAQLSPLWQMMAGGSLQGEAERQAVLRQIESEMTDAQRSAIKEMQLTAADLRTWMQDQGGELPSPADGQGRPGMFQDMSEEERAQMREEFQSMTAEERATRMAEMGFERPQGAPEGRPQGNSGAAPNRGGFGQFNIVLDVLIDLLAERAAE